MSKSARKAERMELRRTIGQRKSLRLSESSRPRTPYHLAHVCFVCRRSNKLSPATTGARKCSRCAGPLYEMGRSFRAPAPDDVEQWTKVQTLYALGFRFVGSGRHQGAPFPERLRDVAAFARDNPEHPLRRADVLRELLPAAPRKRKRAG